VSRDEETRRLRILIDSVAVIRWRHAAPVSRHAGRTRVDAGNIARHATGVKRQCRGVRGTRLAAQRAACVLVKAGRMVAFAKRLPLSGGVRAREIGT